MFFLRVFGVFAVGIYSVDFARSAGSTASGPCCWLGSDHIQLLLDKKSRRTFAQSFVGEADKLPHQLLSGQFSIVMQRLYYATTMDPI